MLTDLHHTTLVTNEKLGELFGFAHQDAVREDPEAVRQWVANRIADYEGWIANLEQVYRDPLNTQEDHLVLKDPYAVLERRTRPVTDERGVPFARLWTFTDRTAEFDRRRIQDLIQEISLFFDPRPSAVYQRIVRGLSDFYNTTSVLSILEGDLMRFQAIASPIPEVAAMTQNELANTYCQFCLEVDAPFVIQNALENPRTAQVLPATVGVTRYVGVPLRTSDRRVIGTLCILDHHSSTKVTEDDLRLLSVMGMRVSGELEREAYLRSLEQDLESAESKMIQNEKLAITGTLAASIAHDIRNIVSAIQLDLSMPGGAEESRLDAVKTHLDRFNILSARLLSYAKPAQIARSRVSLAECVHRMHQLLIPSLGLAGVQLEVGLPAELPEVLGDAARLEHLFMNLFLNALQVTPPGGQISVEGRVDPEWVVVEVSDTGPGMTPEQIQKAFDAFQSSRPDGFGLGLYSCRQILREVGGEIEIDSSLGDGTTIRLRFPLEAS